MLYRPMFICYTLWPDSIQSNLLHTWFTNKRLSNLSEELSKPLTNNNNKGTTRTSHESYEVLTKTTNKQNSLVRVFGYKFSHSPCQNFDNDEQVSGVEAVKSQVRLKVVPWKPFGRREKQLLKFLRLLG